MEIDATLSEKTALACNVLGENGHSNLTMGHVTARNPGDPFIYMNRHDIALEEVTPADIVVIDMEGNQVAGTGRKHSEYPIHTEIYKMYPETHCVVHTHPFSGIIVGSTLGTIQAISHEGSLFADIPLFKSTTLLIREASLGKTVAEKMDGHCAMLLQNHGIVTRGTSIEEATVFAVLLERAAEMQIAASRVGSVSASSTSDTMAKGEQVFYPQNIIGFWRYLVRCLNR